MKDFLTENKQWGLRNVSKFSYKIYWSFVKTSVWLYARNHNNLYPDFIKLASRIERLLRLSGPSFAVLYLKEAHRLTMKTLAGETPEPLKEVRVAMRRGLPLIVPGSLRLLMESKDRVVIKIVLSFLSIFRVLPAWPKLKLETITKPHTGLVKSLPELPLVFRWLEAGYIDRKVYESYFRKEKTLFTEANRLLRLTTAGPNHKLQFAGYPLDALAFRENPVLLKWFKVFAMNTHHKDLWECLQDDINAWTDTPKALGKPSAMELLKSINDRLEYSSLRLGKLSLKKEAAGKVRVFAMVDAWTQSVLAPLHSSLFSILRNIEQDGTFNQLAPVRKLMDKGLKEMYSYDLSAATDRLPIDLQVDILSLLYNNRETAEAWKALLIDRDYHLSNAEFPEANGVYRYAVGQPMGALSSWAMLALTHHLIVQIAALRVGYKGWFEDYAVLGDDIVIANKTVAQAYLVIMEMLGVDINLSKSVQSTVGGCEFAKKLIVSGVDYSPFGVKELFEFIRSPRHFKDYVLNNSVLDLNLIEFDYYSASQFLTSLVQDKRQSMRPKWFRTVMSTWWDLLGLFGLNLTKGLSPLLTEQAIDSLNSEESRLFDDTLRTVLKDAISRGWFTAFEKDVNQYNLLKRKFLKIPEMHFPSADRLLSLFARDMGTHLYRPHVDFDKLTTEELLVLAFSDLSYLTDPFEPTKRQANTHKSKSLVLSKEICRVLATERPHLFLKLMQNSQAFSRLKN